MLDDSLKFAARSALDLYAAVSGLAFTELTGAATPGSTGPATTLRRPASIGGGGDDSVEGGDGADVLTLGDGDDFGAGGRGADTLCGEAWRDSLSGGLGADTLFGGRDAHILEDGAWRDLPNGGARVAYLDVSVLLLGVAGASLDADDFIF